MNRVGRFVKTGEGTYKVTASAQEMGPPDKFNGAFMWKRMPSSFAIEAKVREGNAYGYAGLMVQGDDGHFVASYLYVNGAVSSYGVKRFLPGNATWEQPVLWAQFGNTANYDCYLRMEKRGPDITCLWKDNKGDPWVEIYRYTAPHRMFGKEVALGLCVNGFNSSNPPQFIFSEIEMKAINVPTVIIIR
jgi:regulation of enolase protein 1 (concanavalin A-like superfamily)